MKKIKASKKRTPRKNIPKGASPISGTKPPKNRQFGQPEGNPRHNGAWKKEDTLRYKLQQVAKMTEEELKALTQDPTAGEYEKNIARTILQSAGLDPDKRWHVLEGLTNQDSGFPKQQVDQNNKIKLQSILPKPKQE